jgi:hypothetical protein
MGPLMLVLDQPDNARQIGERRVRREALERGREEESGLDPLLTRFFNERTRRVRDNNDAGGLLACGVGSRS